MNITFDQLIECIGNAEMAVDILVPNNEYPYETSPKCINIIDPQSLIEALMDMQHRAMLDDKGWTGGPR